jgi:hypothetical protein
MMAAQRRGEHETNLALLNNIGGAIALAGFRTRVGDQFHAEGRAIKICSLAGVSNEELNVVGALQWEKVGFGKTRG